MRPEPFRARSDCSAMGDSSGVVMTIDKATLEDAERVLGYTFSDRSLLERALIHASVADDRLASNERLEFLGDAVLGYVVCENLFRRYEDLLEGELTKIKSAVVSR